MRVDKCKILIHNDLNFDRYALIRQPVKSSSRYGSKDCVLQPLITCKLGLEKAQSKVGKVAMVCADDGPDLRGGVRLFCKKYRVGEGI